MYTTQIGRSVCQYICHAECKWWNEMGLQLFFEGTAPHLIIETPPIEFQHVQRSTSRLFLMRTIILCENESGSLLWNQESDVLNVRSVPWEGWWFTEKGVWMSVCVAMNAPSRKRTPKTRSGNSLLLSNTIRPTMVSWLKGPTPDGALLCNEYCKSISYFEEKHNLVKHMLVLPQAR